MRPRRQSLLHSLFFLSHAKWKCILPTEYSTALRREVADGKQEMVLCNYCFPPGRQHDVIEPLAINRHIHAISCQHRHRYTQILLLICFECYSVLSSPSLQPSSHTLSPHPVPPVASPCLVDSQRAVDGHFPGLILACRLALNTCITALPELKMDIR